MRLTAVTAAVTGVLVLAMPMTALASKTPGPPELDHVFLNSLTYGGTGCPQGTVAQSISNDRESFTVVFDSNIATLGPNVPITNSRKNCQLNFNLHVPQGAPNTVFRLRYRGTMQVPQGATALRDADYFFAGDVIYSAGDVFDGPTSQDWQAQDVMPLHLNSGDLALCGQVLPVNVNASIRLIGPSDVAAQMTLDSIEGTIQQTGEGDTC